MTYNAEDLSRVTDLQQHHTFRNTNWEDTVYFSSYQLHGLPEHNHVVANIAAHIGGAAGEVAARLVQPPENPTFPRRHFTAANTPIPRFGDIFAHLSAATDAEQASISPISVIDDCWQPPTLAVKGYRRTVARLLLTALDTLEAETVAINTATITDGSIGFYASLDVGSFRRNNMSGLTATVSRQALQQALHDVYELEHGRYGD